MTLPIQHSPRLRAGAPLARRFAACLAGSALVAAPGLPARSQTTYGAPVLCTTTLEAPMARAAGQSPAGPVEVTRCGITRLPPQVMEQSFYAYTAPFARGIDLTHQITDILGISMGGGDGTKVMGLGFPDQTIVWDGSAVEHTANVMLESQHDPMPLRTVDLASVFGSSLATVPLTEGSTGPYAPALPYNTSWRATVRGLW
jgi:hypothetical protein